MSPASVHHFSTIYGLKEPDELTNHNMSIFRGLCDDVEIVESPLDYRDIWVSRRECFRRGS
jgi:hypothetical protein